MQVLSLFKDSASGTAETVTLIEERCLRRRLSSCDCSHCLASCPAGALSLEEREIRLDSRKCSGCMKCSAVCPNDAFLLPGYSLETRMEPLPEVALAVISCFRQRQVQPGETVVPCLGIFSVESLLLLGMTGPSTVFFNISECSRCENRSVSDSFLRSLSALKRHASPLLISVFGTVTSEDQILSCGRHGRRSFLTVMKDSLLSAAASQLWQRQKDGDGGSTGSKRVPRKVRLVKKLAALVDEEHRPLLAELCTHRLAVSETCTLCPLCTGICPTGAVRVERLNGKKQLRFNSSICSGCGLCATFCKPQAMFLSRPLLSAETGEKAFAGNPARQQAAV